MFSIKAVDNFLDTLFKGVSHAELAQKSAGLGFITSLFLIAIKLIACVATGSISMRASIADSMLDALTSFFIFYALKYSDAKFDEKHNYGHNKVEGVTAVFQCLVIFYSGIMILCEAYESLSNPEPLQNSAIGIGVMIISLIAVYQLIYFQVYAASRTSSMLIKGDSVHYLGDFGLNLGVLASLILSKYFACIDVICGALIGLYVLFNAAQIMMTALHDLMDEALPKKDVLNITKEIKSVPEVKEIVRLRTRSAGMKKYIDVIIKVSSKLSFIEVNDVSNRVEKKLSKLYEKVDIMVKAEPLI